MSSEVASNASNASNWPQVAQEALHYLGILFFYLALAFGVYQEWWLPGLLENALYGGLVGLAGFHAVNYGAKKLTTSTEKPNA